MFSNGLLAFSSFFVSFDSLCVDKILSAKRRINEGVVPGANLETGTCGIDLSDSTVA